MRASWSCLARNRDDSWILSLQQVYVTYQSQCTSQFLDDCESQHRAVDKVLAAELTFPDVAVCHPVG